MERTGILINIPVNLGLSILEISKIVMYKFWYDYELWCDYDYKPKYCKETKLYDYMDILKVIKIVIEFAALRPKTI